jgi:glycosyltransferase involved in cell wall biosynthesis
MEDQLPLVSVVIPAYNAAQFIERTLVSVLTQTYRNIEVLVVDDGSKDETAQIVEVLAQQDDRIHLLQQPNAGVAAARNLGIQYAKGEFIAPIDADDIWYPQNLEKQVETMIEGGDAVGLVYSWSVDIDETGGLLGGFCAAQIQGVVFPTLICHYFLRNASASLIQRSCFDTVGYYDSSLRKHYAQGCEDWDLYLRIAERYEFRVVPEFLIGYRKLVSSMSCDFSQMARSHALVMQSVQQRHPELPSYLFRLSSSNLYIYFAYQSYRSNNFSVTLYWLKRALRADLMTTLIRPGFYRMLLQFIWLGAIKAIASSFNLPQQQKQPISSSFSLSPALTIVALEQRKFKINLTIWVGNVFHVGVLALIRYLSYLHNMKLRLISPLL